MSDSREQFEAWCKSRNQDTTRDDRPDPALAWGYMNMITHELWVGWDAAWNRRALLAAQPATKFVPIDPAEDTLADAVERGQDLENPNPFRLKRAMQPAAATVPQWHPIETAPKGVNGYSFMRLAWGPEDDKSIGDGMRYGDKFFAASVFHCPGKDRRYAFSEHEVNPTHWMSLPQPPAAQAQDDGEKQ